MNDKRFTPSMLAAHRKRQERAARLLLIFWVGVMLLVIGAGYLIYRFLKPGQSPQALTASGTPDLTETYLPSSSPSTTTLASMITQTPIPTLVPTIGAVLPTASFITYTVKEGETLIGIANGLGVGLPTMIALNPSITPEFLKVGDKLTIPAQGSNLTATPAPSGSQAIVEYQVKAGDTVAGIAAQFGTTIGAIVRENNLASPDQIQEGQTLRIPVAASTPSPTPPESTTVAPTSQG